MGWKDRAKPVPAGDWRTRAQPVEGETASTPVADAGPTADAPKAEPHIDSPPFLEGALGSFASGATKQGSDELMGELFSKHLFPGSGGHAAFQADPSGQKAVRMPDNSVRFLKTEDDVYRAVRDFARMQDKGFHAAHPVASFLMNALGDMTSDAALAGAKVLKPAYQTVAGAVSGLMGDDDDLTDAKRTTDSELGAGLNTALGGAAGFIAPKVLPYAGKTIVGGGRALKDFAEQRAVKALGRDLNGVLQGGMGKVQELGRDLLDSGVVNWGRKNLLGTSSEEAGKRLQDLTQQRGERLRGIIGMLDDAAQPEDKLNVNRLVDRLRSKLTSGVAPAEEGVRNTLSKEIDKIGNLGERGPWNTSTLSHDINPNANMGIQQAEDILKKPYQDRLKYDRDMGLKDEALKRLAGELRKAVEENADNIVEKRAPDLEGAFTNAKRRYGLADEGLNIAKAQGKRDLKNNMVTPTDYGAGIAGAAGAGQQGINPTLGAAALAAANHFLKSRGNSMAASGADAAADLAKRFELIPRLMQKYGSAIGTYMSRELLKDYPEALRYLPAGNEAQSKE